MDVGKNANEKKIAFTFDDGPGPYTEQLLDALKKRNVKVTFFVIGENAERYPELLKRMSADGHVIGNHTYSHLGLKEITEKNQKKEIDSVNQMIEEATGKPTIYIRPPYGARSERLDCIKHMITVLWNIDTLDWSVKDEDRITEHILTNAKDGGIVIMHDIYQTSVNAAIRAVDELLKQGYTFVTVDQISPKYSKGCKLIR